MKIIGIIPARYASTRFPGKPLADICGYPMIWWVYKNVSSIDKLDDVFVATDDVRIAEVCDQYDMKYVMTRDNHENHISRVAEVSERYEADYYICVNGDEPLMKSEDIKQVIPERIIDDRVYMGYLMRELTDPAETIDPSNIKISVTETGRIIYMSRSPIPYPKSSYNLKYKKLIGVECMNKKALDFFASTKAGAIELLEDIDPLRFLEHGHYVQANMIESDSLAVDTKNDLERVREIMQRRIKERE